MQRLHLVGFTSELDGLIFSAKTGARSGGYVVALDGELLDAIREVLERRDRSSSHPAPAASFAPARPAQGSALAPREIQARLRAGRRIEDVAMEAGVDDDWVRRFAAPVLAERAHVAARAHAAVLDVEGRGGSSESLGRSVATNLAAEGAVLTPDELDGGWDAYQLRETQWVVEFRAPLRTRDQAARWGFDVRTGRLTALNERATELGWVGADGPGAASGGVAPASGAGGARGGGGPSGADEHGPGDGSRAAAPAPIPAPEPAAARPGAPVELPFEPASPRRARRSRATAPDAALPATAQPAPSPSPSPEPPGAARRPARAARARPVPPVDGANGAGG